MTQPFAAQGLISERCGRRRHGAAVGRAKSRSCGGEIRTECLTRGSALVGTPRMKNVITPPGDEKSTVRRGFAVKNYFETAEPRVTVAVLVAVPRT